MLYITHLDFPHTDGVEHLWRLATELAFELNGKISFNCRGFCRLGFYEISWTGEITYG